MVLWRRSVKLARRHFRCRYHWMTPFFGFPLSEGEAGASGAGAGGASASGASAGGASAGEASAGRASAGGAGTSVADGVVSGLILSANSRMAKRRHLTSL